MTTASLLFLTVLAGADGHEKINPVYRSLRQEGLAVKGAETAKLPIPIMADGLTAAQQKAVLTKLLGEEYRMEDFLRNLVAAPYRLRLGDAKPSDPQNPAKTVQVTFVAHGNRRKLANKAFLDSVLDSNKGSNARALTAAELVKRKLPAPDEKKEGYAYIVFNLIDRVELRAVGYSYLSETPDSILVAGRLDPRFRGDPAYPNQWRPLVRKGSGFQPTGKPAPYDSAAYYVKITSLREPPGALFVEAHVIFTEPRGWFDGKNLLRSKLPQVIQTQVRTFRRELLKAK